MRVQTLILNENWSRFAAIATAKPQCSRLLILKSCHHPIQSTFVLMLGPHVDALTSLHSKFSRVKYAVIKFIYSDRVILTIIRVKCAPVQPSVGEKFQCYKHSVKKYSRSLQCKIKVTPDSGKVLWEIPPTFSSCCKWTRSLTSAFFLSSADFGKSLLITY